MDIVRLRKKPIYRRPGVVFREEDEETYLIDQTHNSIHTLNLLGRAVWRLLDEPRSINAIGDILCQAFPDEKKSRIRKDVQNLIHDLYTDELVDIGKPADPVAPDENA